MTTRRHSPTVKARRVAGTLREFRERAGISMVEAAKKIDHDGSWLSRVERLETRPHPNDVRALLGMYGLDERAIEAVVTVARQAKQRGWWYRYSPLLPEWFDTYIGLETDASFIRTFEPQLIPGLLQTEAYARAAMMAGSTPERPDRIDERVALRMERQALLTNEDPPQMRVVLDEGALRRCIGGRAVMHAQVEHLIKMSEQPNIQIQVLAFETGGHAGLDGAFVLLDFLPLPVDYPGAAEDKIVYVDTLLSALYLEGPAEVSAYAAAFEQLRADALEPQQSRELLDAIAASLKP